LIPVSSASFAVW